MEDARALKAQLEAAQFEVSVLKSSLGKEWRRLEKLEAVATAIKAVKAAQHGPLFWQCECGVLESLDEAVSELDEDDLG